MNKNLNKARKQRNDEFYTRYEDVEKEVEHYWEYLRGKVVYCNCDDYRWSNFVNYFKDHFHDIGIKALVATNYDIGEGAYHYHWEGEGEPTVKLLEGDGSYDSPECLEILRNADVVVTNPPFSLFREYINCLIEEGKEFLVIGNLNAITYKEIFPLIKGGRVGVGRGFNKAMEFSLCNSYEKYSRIEGGVKYGRVPSITWYTTLPTIVENPINPSKSYFGNEDQYPKYDNYDAIEVGRVANIPKDYYGVMGVPVNYLGNHNKDLFKIVGSNRGRGQCPHGYFGRSSYINGKETFKRIFIQRRKI